MINFLKNIFEWGDTNEAKAARQAFRNLFKDGELITMLITPFSYVLFSINFLFWALLISYNHERFQNIVLTLLGIVSASVSSALFCWLMYEMLNDFVFSKFNRLKSELGSQDSFPKMTAKIIISCCVTFLVLFALIQFP